MRILHVAEVLHGGVISLVRDFAEAQTRAGHDVHLLLRPEVPAAAGTMHHWSPDRRRPVALARGVRQLSDTIDAVRPDVVHLHSFFPGLLGRMRRPKEGPATVYQPHSWAFQAVPPSLAPAVAAWERIAARRATMVITNCRDEWAEAEQRGVRADVRIVGVPVDTSRFHPVSPAQRQAVRRELGLTAPHVVVCVGRLSAQKGQDLLVSAWEEHPAPDSVLVLVGPGDPGYLAELAPRTFGGSVVHVGAQADVRPWLWAADLAVLPSRYEGQSVAMVEALACGAPVVMTDVNGGKEAVSPLVGNAAGAVVPVGDMTGLLHEVALRLDSSRHAVSHLERQAARERAVELFGRDAVMGRVESAYIEALATARPHVGVTTRGALT
jgi:glycosyltransferase involved in cell wall biosynthesis